MNSKAFSLVEIVIVLAIIGIIASIAIPNFRAVQREGQYTKVESELETLKVAITSYWKHNDHQYPTNIHSDLISATPALISSALTDPWDTDSTNHTYGYIKGSDELFGNYFILYSKGPNANTLPTFNSDSQKVEFSGEGVVSSNAPITKQ